MLEIIWNKEQKVGNYLHSIFKKLHHSRSYKLWQDLHTVSVSKRWQYLCICKGSFISSRIPFSIQTGLFGQLHFAVFTLVLELINKVLNFTADVLIYHIVYSHKDWVVTVLLLFTQLFTAVFTLVLELTDKELNFTVDVFIYCIVY